MNKEEKQKMNETIINFYGVEDSGSLALRLGITVHHLRVKAGRLGVKRKPFYTNEIIDGKKYCPHCKEMKEIHYFNRDRYQMNQYDVYCRKCRHLTNEERRLSKAVTINEDVKEEHFSQGFGLGKKRNFPEIIKEEKFLRCKSCGKLKHLDTLNFSIDRKNKIHGYRNYCKECSKELTAKNSQKKKEAIEKKG